MATKTEQTVMARIFPADLKKVSEQAVGREHTADTLHRIIKAGIESIEETKRE